MTYICKLVFLSAVCAGAYQLRSTDDVDPVKRQMGGHCSTALIGAYMGQFFCQNTSNPIEDIDPLNADN